MVEQRLTRRVACLRLPGKALSDTPLGTICIIIIFFISGLKLKTDEIKQTLSAWREAGFGFATILLLTPLIAFVVVSARNVGLLACAPSTSRHHARCTTICCTVR